MLLTAGLRNMGGTDYYVYEDDYTGFRSYDGNGLKAMFELGYTMFVQLGNWLSLSYNGFIFFLTFLSLLLVFKFYWKRSVYPLLSLLLYVGNFFLYYN
ncbi:MAG: EpsG family protein, partial [Odoribacter sp.]|nr:EpsG family protein [Odoribacter sp.]